MCFFISSSILTPGVSVAALHHYTTFSPPTGNRDFPRPPPSFLVHVYYYHKQHYYQLAMLFKCDVTHHNKKIQSKSANSVFWIFSLFLQKILCKFSRHNALKFLIVMNSDQILWYRNKLLGYDSYFFASISEFFFIYTKSLIFYTIIDKKKVKW